MLDSIDRSVQFPNRFRAMPVAGTKDILDLVPAPGEVNEEGTLWNRRASQLMQGDRRYYPVKAGQSIHAGDVVDVVGGEVGKAWRAEANVEVVQYAVNTILTAALGFNKQHSLVAIGVSSAVRVYLVKNTNGSPDSYADLTGTAKSVALCQLSDTTFAAAIVSPAPDTLNGKIGVLTGSKITFGNVYKLSADGTTEARLVDLGDNQLLAVYNRSGLKSKVFPVTDTVINTTSTTEKPLPGNTSASYLSATRPPDLNGNKRVCVCFADGSNGNQGKAVIATIKPDNTVEWGTVVTFNAGNTGHVESCEDNGDVIVSYQNIGSVEFPGNPRCAKVIKAVGANGLDATANGYLISKGNYGPMPLANVGGRLVAVNSTVHGNTEDGGGGIAYIIKRTDTRLEVLSWYRFSRTSGVHSKSSLSMSNTGPDGVVVAYADGDNNKYGTATILTVHGDQIAGSFTDTSSDCIALQDAASGQPCEVIFDGVAELPGFVAGTEINSPGVYGYCPEDGRVWVRPEWDSGVVTGSFTSQKNLMSTITLGFRPKLVILYNANNNNSDTAGNASTTTSIYIPRIYTSGLYSESGGGISEDGFTFKHINAQAGGDTYTIYFVALK